MSEDRHTRFLGIPAGLRPPHAHVLLGVEPDVNDPEIIEAAVQRRMDELDKFALSNDRTTREQVQKLMNEVAKARVKLTQRAEGQAKKAAPIETPEPTPTPVVPAQTPTTEQPPIAAVEHVPVPRKASLNFKFKFQWPRLSAEAWSLLGIAWLMSLAVTAVGAYFVASSKSIPELAPIAGNTPTLPKEGEPPSEPTPGPAPNDPPAQVPPVEPDETTEPTKPVASPTDPILTWEQVEQIKDPDARLQAFIRLRDSKEDFRQQIELIRRALGLFNGIPDVKIATYDAGNDKMKLIVKVAHVGDRDNPNFGITDISPLTGFKAHGLTLGNLINIRDFEPLRTARINHLNVSGCTGLTDYSLFKSIDGLQALILDRTNIDDLNKLTVQRLDWLSLQNCQNLTSLDGLEGKTIETLIASRNSQLNDIDALRVVRGLKEVNLSHTSAHRLDALAAHQLTQLDLGSCFYLASITPLEQVSTLERLVLPPVGSRILQSDLYQLQGRLPGLTIAHSADRLKEPDEIVHTQIADHNKLDRFKDPADRHAAFIKLRESYEPFSKEQVDLIWRELLYINNTNHVMFQMDAHATEPKIMIGVVDNLAGNQNNAITDLSPLNGINTHTLSVQRLPNLQDFRFLTGSNIHTLDLTGCSQFKDVSILKEVKGLSILKMNETAVSDLRPLRLESLQVLAVDGCKSLRDLNGLQGLTLEALSAVGCTSLREVSALASVKGLKSVNLAQTAIQSASPLARQGELTILSLSGCDNLSTLAGLSRLKGLKKLYLHDTPMLDHVDTERLKKLLPNTTISFEDEGVALEPNADADAPPDDDVPTVKTIKELMRIKDGQTRFKAYLKLRDSLELYSDEQKELIRWVFAASHNEDGMGLNLRRGEHGYDLSVTNLNLGGEDVRKKVTDLSAFSGMTFNQLDLSSCQNLIDLRPLEGTTIRNLDLGWTNVTYLGPINEIKGLQTLDLGSTPIIHVKQLEIDQLDRLDLGRCRNLRSLDGLEGMTIRSLNLEGGPKLTDLSALSQIKGLEYLELQSLNITSLRPLAGLKLKQLDVDSCNQLRSITELRKMDTLEVLYIRHTAVSERDIKSLQKLVPDAKIWFE